MSVERILDMSATKTPAQLAREMEQAAERLYAENCMPEARTNYVCHPALIVLLREGSKQIASLLADKQRLDWLECSGCDLLHDVDDGGISWSVIPETGNHNSVRLAIDSAMKSQ